MLEIENTLIDEEIAESFFVCDLKKCQGNCCKAGELGAPLKEVEALQISQEINKIIPLLPQENQEYLQFNKPTEYINNTWRTPSLKNGQCVYAIEKNKVLACSIELAYKENIIEFNKPISCHLYPIRSKNYEIENESYELLFYHHWQICSPACELGQQLNIPLYVFLKDALIRAYGEIWYQKLLTIIEQ
jgi:hypothetical protein